MTTQYPQYQQPPYPPEPGYDAIPQHQDQDSLGSWVLTTFLMFIPLVNLIYLLVLAFGGGYSPGKRNFARATLIWMLVGFALSILLGILFAAAGLSIFSELSNNYSLIFG